MSSPTPEQRDYELAFYKANEACSVREAEILRLRAALANAKAEAWDEGYGAGIHDEVMSQDFDGGMTPPARVNPYEVTA